MPTLSWLCKRGYQLLFRHIVIILVALLCLGLGIGFAGSYHLSNQVVESQAQQYASVTATMLKHSRAAYAEKVVQALKSVEEVELSPNYSETVGGVPLAATFTIELAERVSELTEGSHVRIYSDYPFPIRAETGGVRDNFEQEALTYFRQNQSPSFQRREKLGERVTFRYAEPVRMKQMCVDCHNAWPGSPKTDWQVGEVAGVIAITQSLDNVLLLAQKGLRNIYVVLMLITMLAMGGLSLVTIGRFRLINVELEEKVQARTEELHRLANWDCLTQIANRRHFGQAADEEWRRAIRYSQSISLLMCDVDFFKQYNDTYGHRAGDECLRAVAQVLKNCAQRAGEVVARYGGEEFAIILPNLGREDAVKVANKIRKELAKWQIPHAASEVDSYVTISIGIATLIPQQGKNWEDLLQGADQALYEAKERGRDRHAVWNE